MILSLFSVLLLLVPIFLCGDPCPPKEDLGPCTCSFINARPVEKAENSSARLQHHDTNANEVIKAAPLNTPVVPHEWNHKAMNTIVECNVTGSIFYFEATLKTALHRRMVDKLIVSNVPPLQEHALSRLPNKCFKNARIKELEICDTPLSWDFLWHDNPLEGQANSLVWLTVRRCNLYGSLSFSDIGIVNTKGLNELPGVEGVDFSFNFLTVIKSTAFRYPSANLSTVILSRNSIGVVESGSFQYIPRLKHVDLSHNLLKSIIRDIFQSPARYLENIDFSWNYLKSLPSNFFVNMPSLKIVNFSKNFLYSMPEQPWAPAWNKLIFVDVNDNFIDCNCDLLWLLRVMFLPNGTATTSHALPEQTVHGRCNRHGQMPGSVSTQHELVKLTKQDLMC